MFFDKCSFFTFDKKDKHPFSALKNICVLNIIQEQELRMVVQ